MESPLLPMPAWQARSFWIALVGASLQIATLFNFDLLGLFGVTDADQMTDSIMQVVAAVALIWAWFERKAPMRQLSLSGESTTSTIRSPAWIGAGVIALVALAACDPLTNRLTPDACAKAQLALVLAEVNSDLVPPETIDRLRRNIVVLCPPEVAEELEAEMETEVGEDVALPLDVVAPPADEASEP